MSRFRGGPPVVVLALASLSGVALLAVPEPAAACGKGVCARGYFAPRDATTVPANVPALVHANTQPAPNGTPSVTITTDEGATPLAFTSGAPGILRLDAPLQVGKAYAVSHYQSCGTGASVGFASQSFVAGPAAPLPTIAGATSAPSVTVEQAYEAYTSAGSCTVELRSSVVRIGFTPAPELVPYLPITSFALSVDGVPVGQTPYGQGPNEVLYNPYWQRPLLQLYGACEEPARRSDDRGLTLGSHTYTLEAIVAGASAQPAKMAGTFTLTCDPAPSGSGGASGGSAGAGSGPGAGFGFGFAGESPGFAGSGSTGSGPPGGAPPSSGASPAAGSGGGADGCGITPGSSSFGTNGLGLLVTLGAIVLRRTRRRR